MTMSQLDVDGFPISWKDPQDADTVSMFDVIYGKVREKIILQRLIMISRLPHDLADRTDLGAHYENLNFQLNKQYIWDHITGLLLIYPSYLLHIIESSRDILTSVLRDVKVMQQQPHRTLLEVKIVFLDHNPQRRLFQQWSYKVLGADQVIRDPAVKVLEDEDVSIETLVCSVLSTLQNLSKKLEKSKALPGSVLDETPQLIVHQKILERLLGREELLSLQQYLDMYKSTLNISIEFGQLNPRNLFSAV
ncbi:testis-expressed protein 47 [Maylandia zebra]|uniref:testis-expressed protein 47 n=1 Tax=Maylandia zebra TaxID=106582 RepID=UPI000648205F|nr:testis-expressed protein 47 [Maylandia zebra]XP_026033810.1 testis-expressed protein 47 isoform X1 [Astatotilapia calliptera]